MTNDTQEGIINAQRDANGKVIAPARSMGDVFADALTHSLTATTPALEPIGKTQTVTKAGLIDMELPYYESMTKATDPKSGATIRVWRREPELPEYADAEILATINSQKNATMREMVSAIAKLERVTAIELTDADGLGAVIYLEW